MSTRQFLQAVQRAAAAYCRVDAKETRSVTRIRHLLPALAWLVSHACFAQSASASERAACDQFLGLWSGTWSQGYYGTQRILRFTYTDPSGFVNRGVFRKDAAVEPRASARRQ